MNQKYDIIYADLKKTFEDPANRQAFNNYLVNHPDVKKEFDDFQQVLKKMADEINAEMNRLYPKEAVPNPAGP